MLFSASTLGLRRICDAHYDEVVSLSFGRYKEAVNSYLCSWSLDGFVHVYSLVRTRPVEVPLRGFPPLCRWFRAFPARSNVFQGIFVQMAWTEMCSEVVVQRLDVPATRFEFVIPTSPRVSPQCASVHR